MEKQTVKKSRHHRRRQTGWMFIAPFGILFIFVFIIPIIYSIYISLFQNKLIGGQVFVGLANYKKLLVDGDFWDGVKRVMLYTIIQVPVMLIISQALALGLDSLRLRGTKFIRIVAFLPYGVPAIVSTLMWGFMLGTKYGLFKNINAFFGPFKDMKLQSLPNIPNSSDIKTKALQSFISSAGEGGLIVATDKPSVAMIKGAQLLAESQYDYVTGQFEVAINTVLNKWCGCKYYWKLNLWGGIYTFENKVKILKELAASGATFVLPQLASAFNKSLTDVRAINGYIEANKLYEGFKTLGWAQSTQNAQARGSSTQDSNGVGRTALDDTDIENDSTAQSRETGANITELKEDYVAQHICPLCGSEDVEDGHFLCSECEEKMELDGEE